MPLCKCVIFEWLIIYIRFSLLFIYYVFTESDISADLYIAFSGSFGDVGVYKFGRDGLSPINRYKGSRVEIGSLHGPKKAI